MQQPNWYAFFVQYFASLSTIAPQTGPRATTNPVPFPVNPRFSSNVVPFTISINTSTEAAIPSSQAAVSTTSCPGTDLTGDLRSLIVQKHNDFRSQLAQGQAPVLGGFNAPTAQNMYKMEYSCALEAIAQNWANGCSFSHSTASARNNTGENLYMMGMAGYNPSSALTDAATLWWNELRDLGGITSTSVQLTMAAFNLGIGHWSQMAWGKTTHVGCGYKSCVDQRMTLVVCNYSPAGNWLNEDIYEMGSPCSSNGQCTTYPSSSCDLQSKLCSVQ